MEKHLDSTDENDKPSTSNDGSDIEKKSFQEVKNPTIGYLISSLLEKLFFLFKNPKGSLIGTVMVAIMGAIAFWATPIKEKIYHLIWQERVEIRVGTSPLIVIAGKPFNVQPSIINKGNVDIVEGDFRVSYDDRYFKHVSGNTTAHTPSVKSSHPLKEDLGLRLSPRKVGNYPIAFEFTTSYGSYQDTLWIQSENSLGKVTSMNWTGTWSGSLGGNSLQVDWVESKASGNLHSHIGSFVIFDLGETGRVTGSRDGNKFNGDLFKAPNDLVKWTIVDAPFSQKENAGQMYIEITGKAIQKIKKNDMWVSTELKPQDFTLQATVEF